MANDLIYDIGMHVGNDTAFYLACGFRVVAVEADPQLVAAAQQRFKREIESQRLTILNFGVAEHAATALFWINEVRPSLNSFSQELTARSGEPHHSIMITCRRLDDILSEYGIPFYMKIDIEGHDLVCCNQLSPETKPQYISVEMSRVELLLKLRDLGYERFKLIDQRDLQPVGPQDIDLHVHFLRSLHRLAHSRPADRKLSLRFKRAGAAKVLQLASALGAWQARRPFKSRLVPEWDFTEEEFGTYSGTFGEDLPGEWLGWEEIAYLWHREANEHQKIGRELLCDLHATVSVA